MCGYVITSDNAQSTASQTSFESLMRLAGKAVECPFCEKKVVVPASDLSDGKLYCRDCNIGVDVCTGKKFSKKNVEANSEESFVDIFANEMRQWNRNYDKRQIEKKAARKAVEKQRILKEAA